MSRCAITPNTERRTPNASAFTLIEALIAIVLIAAVLPVALSAISHVMQGVSTMQKQAVAMRQAESLLAQWLADGSWQTAAASGEFSTASSTTRDGENLARYHWQLTVTPWRDPAIKMLHLTVTWEPSSDANTLSLNTLVTTPATGT